MKRFEFIGENISSFRQKLKLSEIAHKLQRKESYSNGVMKVVTLES